MKTNIGISEKNSLSVVNELSKILADEYILSTKTRNAHWNVEGPDFIDKHKFFETQFGQLDEFIDSVAERIRSLGHYAPASLSSFLSLTQLTEMNREKNDSHGFITGLMESHEKMAWFLRSHL